MDSTKNSGRPRSQQIDDAIFSAANTLFYQQSYADVSMEQIAQLANVSKATLYRRWPNKAVLAVDVLVRVALAEKRPFAQTSYREHLLGNLKALKEMLASPYATMIISLIAEAQQNQELHKLLYERFLRPVQAVGDADLELAIKRGEIKPTVDKNLLFDQLFGFFYYRMLVVRKEIKTRDIEQIVNAFFAVSAVNN